jgi:hypothetical protein
MVQSSSQAAQCHFLVNIRPQSLKEKSDQNGIAFKK